MTEQTTPPQQTQQTPTGGQPQFDFSSLQKRAEQAATLERDLADRDRELQELRELRESSLALVRGEQTPETEQHVRRLMHAAGRRPEEIDAYIQQLNQSSEDPDDDGEDEITREIGALRQDLEKQREHAVARERERLDSMFQGAARSQVDTNEEIGTIFKKLEAIQGEEATEPRRKLAERRIRDLTLQRCKERRLREGGRWDDRFIAEEAKAAAKDYLENELRASIGDVSRLGAVPETGPDSDDYFELGDTPVEAPPMKATGLDSKVAQVERYTTDALTRLLRESPDQ